MHVGAPSMMGNHVFLVLQDNNNVAYGYYISSPVDAITPDTVLPRSCVHHMYMIEANKRIGNYTSWDEVLSWKWRVSPIPGGDVKTEGMNIHAMDLHRSNNSERFRRFASRIDADGENKRNAVVQQRWDQYAQDH